MVILERPTGMGGRFVLYQYGERFAFGYAANVDTRDGFPVNQCGSIDEVIAKLESRIEIAHERDMKYDEYIAKEGTDGWDILKDQNKHAADAFIAFHEYLCNVKDKRVA